MVPLAFSGLTWMSKVGRMEQDRFGNLDMRVACLTDLEAD